MNHLKLYEEINDESSEPKVGDYVITKYMSADDDHEANLFVTKNIGQLYKIEKDKYTVKYENIPSMLHYYTSADSFLNFKRRDIQKWSENKQDLETILLANKFNI